MPYSSIRELPAAVKTAHPSAECQRVFVAVFNARAKAGDDDATCMRMAHTAATRCDDARRASVRRG